jgi:hypothetical protein
MVIIKSHDSFAPGEYHWFTDESIDISYRRWVRSLGGRVFLDGSYQSVEFENDEDATAFKLRYM